MTAITEGKCSNINSFGGSIDYAIIRSRFLHEPGDSTSYKNKMEYRRFGKTDKRISVITLGGMRFENGWDQPRDHIPENTLQHCKATTEKALAHGINHIETAWGYIKSEHALGIVLNDLLKVQRESYYLMTKGSPKTAEEAREMVGKQLKALKTDTIDFYGWHGINTREILESACAAEGPVRELLKMKNEGIIGHVGFSTHAPLDVIIRAIETDLFEFVNLHYYYILPAKQRRNRPGGIKRYGSVYHFAQ